MESADYESEKQNILSFQVSTENCFRNSNKEALSLFFYFSRERFYRRSQICIDRTCRITRFFFENGSWKSENFDVILYIMLNFDCNFSGIWTWSNISDWKIGLVFKNFLRERGSKFQNQYSSLNYKPPKMAKIGLFGCLNAFFSKTWHDRIYFCFFRSELQNPKTKLSSNFVCQ